MRLTACECAVAGWCSRHRCLKDDSLFHLCRRNQVFFDAWESGVGPCLPVVVDSERDESGDGPSLLRRALNYGHAVMRHTVDGLRRVDQATYDARLTICLRCPACDTERSICRQPACGCCLGTRAWWASERGPLGRWPEMAMPSVDPASL